MPPTPNKVTGDAKASPQGGPSPSSYSTIWAYLWDLLDDGIDEAVPRLRDAGLDGVSVATAYHTFQQLRPHRPGPKLLTAERAAVYFQPDQSLYADTVIRPHVAALAQGANPLEHLARASRDAGLDLISWTVCLHNTFLAHQFPDCAQQTAYGDSLGWHLCPGSPDVRTYVVALARDLAVNYGCRRIELESCNFGGYGHAHHHVKDGVDLGSGGRYLFSLSFSPGCVQRAHELGIDVEGLRTWVRDQLDPVFAGAGSLDRDPAELVDQRQDLAAYQAMREDLVTTLVAEVRQACDGAQVSILLMGDRWTAGLRPEALSQAADLVEILAYTDSSDAVAERASATAAQLRHPGQLVLGLQAYAPCALRAETLVEHVRRVRSCGIRELSFYNYGIMPRSNLDWIRRSLA